MAGTGSVKDSNGDTYSYNVGSHGVKNQTTGAYTYTYRLITSKNGVKIGDTGFTIASRIDAERMGAEFILSHTPAKDTVTPENPVIIPDPFNGGGEADWNTGGAISEGPKVYALADAGWNITDDSMGYWAITSPWSDVEASWDTGRSDTWTYGGESFVEAVNEFFGFTGGNDYGGLGW